MLKSYSFVHYRGQGSKEAVLSLLRDCDMFVLVSNTETFGLVYAEAMTQGVPVIYTRGQGFDGQFENGFVGYATSDTNVQELADNICLAWKHYERLSSNCIAVCQNFDWNRVIHSVTEIYTQAIE